MPISTTEKISFNIMGSAWLPIVAVAVYGIISFAGLTSMMNNSDWVEHTHKVIASASDIEKLILDLETGERGYLITGQEKFLEPYEAAEKDLIKKINETKLLVDDNNSQVLKIEKIEKLLNQWFSSAANVEIETRRKASLGHSKSLHLQDDFKKAQGKKIFDDIRTYLDELDQMFDKANHQLAKTNVLAIAKNLVDMETGQRGFIVTGDETFLEPYHLGQAELKVSISSLHQLIDGAYDRNVMLKDIEEIKALALRWQTEIARPAIKLRNKVNSNKSSFNEITLWLTKNKGKDILDRLADKTERLVIPFEKANNHEGEHLLLNVMKGNLELESKLRNFLITGKQSSLDLYRLSESSLQDNFLELESEVSASYSVNRARLLLNYVVRSSDQWNTLAAFPEIEMRREITNIGSDIDDVIDLIDSQTGKKLMDKIRVSITDFKNTEKVLMERRKSSANVTAQLTLWINILGVLLIIAFSVSSRKASKKMQDVSEKLSVERLVLENQDWVKSSYVNAIRPLVGELNLKHFADVLMEKICPKLDAQFGSFYCLNSATSIEMEGDESKDFLYFVGGYAGFNSKQYDCTDGLKQFSLGEGLIGQCALQETDIFLDEPSDDTIKIESSLGEMQPKNIVIFPVLFSGHLLGVIELASVNCFSAVQLDLIEMVKGNLGGIFNNIISQRKTESLLANSQLQTEKLQSQQEELTANNEILEEQTQQLQASEEELNSSNEELRVQQDILKAQKNQLEIAKNDVEKKSEDLKLASKYKSEFLANMSHELRTPLNSMLILSKMLVNNKEGNLNTKQKEDVQVIYDGGKDLLTLINDIMDLSKVEAGMMSIHLEKVVISSVTNSIERLFEHVAKDKGLEFVIEQEASVPEFIQSDGQRIEQVLKNFLSNAFKFTDQGSVTLGIHSLETGIGFSVKDSGIGISEEKQQAIFESFQQEDGSTSRKYGGTGLGLSISKELAKLLGGEILLESEAGKGSTFTLSLPLQIDQESESLENSAVTSSTEQEVGSDDKELAKAKNEPTAAKEEAALQSLALQSMEFFVDDDRHSVHESDNSILIIEDDAKFAQVLLDVVRSNQYKGLVSNKGRDGLFLAMQHKPNGILLDVGLPDINGLSVLEQLKFHNDTRDIPVHIISGRDTGQHTFLSGGAFSFLTKPVNVESIDSILSTLTKVDDVKKVLVIEDDELSQKAIEALISNDKVKVNVTTSGAEALEHLQSEECHCIILDLGLPDMEGTEILEKISALPQHKNTPIIIYTAREVSDEEQVILSKYSDSIIIKGAESLEHLLNDVSLFLHQVSSSLPEESSKEISLLHDDNSMLEGRRVLLVDDDMRNLFALSRQLEDIGLEVEIAANGQLALDALAETRPDGDSDNRPFELILMDIMMPVMDGYEAMTNIRQLEDYKDVPIIALTAKAMQEDRGKCIDAGASEYLTKPIDLDKLSSILRIWLYQAQTKLE